MKLCDWANRFSKSVCSPNHETRMTAYEEIAKLLLQEANAQIKTEKTAAQGRINYILNQYSEKADRIIDACHVAEGWSNNIDRGWFKELVDINPKIIQKEK